MKISRDAHPLFDKISDTRKVLLLFWLFFIGNSVMPILWTLVAKNTIIIISDPALKNVENFTPTYSIFLLFFRRKCWQDFVTPFSTFANIKGSLLTNSTTLDRLRYRGPEQRTDGVKIFIARFLANCFFEHHQQKVFLKGPSSSPDLHPERSP